MVSTGDNMMLFLVCDTSGSMNENGKCMLMRGIARSVEQFIRLGHGRADLQLVFWNASVIKPDWNPDDDFPEQMLNCSGSAELASLIEALGEEPQGKILVLSDGWWGEDDMTRLKKWKRKLPKETLRIMRIGSDANPLLKGDDVFSPDDFFDALDGWLPCESAVADSAEEDEW